MKIICDTHIWYYLGQDKNLFEKVKDEPIAPTHVNIAELTRTENIIEKEDLTRAAIQKVFYYKENAIYELPLQYIVKLTHGVEFGIDENLRRILEFTSLYASGYSIDHDNIKVYQEYVDKRRNDFNKSCDFINSEAEEIGKNIKNKNNIWNKNTMQRTCDNINSFITTASEGKYNMIGIEIDNIILLAKCLDYFFKKLIVSRMRMQPNDWFDIFILAYVQPGDKFWTLENRWIKLIKECGMESYLFKENG